MKLKLLITFIAGLMCLTSGAMNVIFKVNSKTITQSDRFLIQVEANDSLCATVFYEDLILIPDFDPALIKTLRLVTRYRGETYYSATMNYAHVATGGSTCTIDVVTRKSAKEKYLKCRDAETGQPLFDAETIKKDWVVVSLCCNERAMFYKCEIPAK